MNTDYLTNPCRARACIFNVDGRCCHALQPSPRDCVHWRARPSIVGNDIVSILREGRPRAVFSPEPAPAAS